MIRKIKLNIENELKEVLREDIEKLRSLESEIDQTYIDLLLASKEDKNKFYIKVGKLKIKIYDKILDISKERRTFIEEKDDVIFEIIGNLTYVLETKEMKCAFLILVGLKNGDKYLLNEINKFKTAIMNDFLNQKNIQEEYNEKEKNELIKILKSFS